MSPRIDHRPPIIAFLLLVVVAVAVIGTSARGVDGWVFETGPLATRAEASGPVSAPQVATERVHEPAPVARAEKRAQSPSRREARELPSERGRARPEWDVSAPKWAHHEWRKRSKEWRHDHRPDRPERHHEWNH